MCVPFRPGRRSLSFPPGSRRGLLLVATVVAQDIYQVILTIDGVDRSLHFTSNDDFLARAQDHLDAYSDPDALQGGRDAAAARVAALMEDAVTRRNVELYKSVWDSYADRWRADKRGLALANEHRDAATPLVWLGDEWGPRDDFLEVFEAYVARMMWARADADRVEA